MISRLPKLKHLDDRIIDQDESTEAIRMYGTVRKRKRDGRFKSELERMSGIMLKDFKSSSTRTALEAADDTDDVNENVGTMAEQQSSDIDTQYYTFEEHVQFLIKKFSEKCKAWKESFKNPNDGI